MSDWERLGADGVWHPLTKTQDREARSRFKNLMDAREARITENPDAFEDHASNHLEVGSRRGDQTGFTLIGHAKDLHGPEGVCTCCPRRSVVSGAA